MSPTRPGHFNVTRLGPILEDIHERLAGVVIEQLRWQDFLTRYDRPSTLFYLDPPYWGSEGDYGRGMFGRDEFTEMAAILCKLKARFIVSINDCSATREIFAEFDMQQVSVAYTVAGGSRAQNAAELIVTKAVREI